MTQPEMYRQFDMLRAKYAAHGTRPIYDAILDTMDIISEWCRLDARLFDTELRR